MNKTDIFSIKLGYKVSDKKIKRLYYFWCPYKVAQKCSFVILRIKLIVSKTKQAPRGLPAIAEIRVRHSEEKVYGDIQQLVKKCTPVGTLQKIFEDLFVEKNDSSSWVIK